jgi:F0F1-type ATP synthase membrane subunit c/vacuolar-type H+-ATPase subunit K
MCGIAVGTTGATCAVSDAQNPELFVKVLIVEVSPVSFVAEIIKLQRGSNSTEI